MWIKAVHRTSYIVVRFSGKLMSSFINDVRSTVYELRRLRE